MKDGSEWLLLLVTTSYAFYAFGMVLHACELGERSSDAFDEIVEKIYQLEWYSFVKEMRQMLPLIINVAQQPVEIECFGTISCSRETFKKVRSANKSFKIFQ